MLIGPFNVEFKTLLCYLHWMKNVLLLSLRCTDRQSRVAALYFSVTAFCFDFVFFLILLPSERSHTATRTASAVHIGLLAQKKRKKKKLENNSSHVLPVRSVAGVRFHLDGAPPRGAAVNIFSDYNK